MTSTHQIFLRQALSRAAVVDHVCLKLLSSVDCLWYLAYPSNFQMCITSIHGEDFSFISRSHREDSHLLYYRRSYLKTVAFVFFFATHFLRSHTNPAFALLHSLGEGKSTASAENTALIWGRSPPLTSSFSFGGLFFSRLVDHTFRGECWWC